MRTTKKLIVLTMVAILAVVSFVPATFSWYLHSGELEGKLIRYSDNLPISIKSGSGTISMQTYEADANGIAGSDTVTGISVAPDSSTQKAVKYYKTVFTNSGNNDVYLDFETNNLANNADFVIGTLSPTLNEKAYASRPVRTKVTNDTVRIYFKPNTNMSSYWSVDNGRLLRETGTYMPDGTTPSSTADAGSSAQTSSSTGTTNDINLSYTAGGKEVQVMMSKCPTADSNWSSTGTKVYYYDIPSSTTSFYFFNHWYLRSSSNREWNRTLDITDTTQGKLYYMTNNSIDGKYKEYKAKDVDTNLVALNQYYSKVRLSMGASSHADIGLKKDSDTEDPDFVPEYYGSSITYTSANTGIATVNKDGLVTPVAAGSTTITTKVTGRFGDYKEVTTTIDIPTNISEVPIIQNLHLGAQGTTNEKGGPGNRVVVDWYVINRSASATMTTSSLYFTL